MAYWLVMPAAGAGRRFGGGQPKQYAPLAGRTVIEWALAPFLADRRCLGIRVALAPDDDTWPTPGIRAVGHDRLRTVTGGEERCESVRLAVASLPASPDDWVLVHDAARPCIRRAEVDRLLEEAGAADGGLLAVPLADTLKRAVADDGASRSAETLPREDLWRAQTPQMFRHGALLEALTRCHAQGQRPTDEAQAMEFAGHAPRLVPGDPRNLKITTAADLALAAAILAGGDA